jgi:hypothetical protein
MRTLRLFVFLILAGGLGGFLGSVVGGAFGRRGLFVGGFIGGAILTWVAARIAGRFEWIPREQIGGVAIGATMGFLVAASIAVNTLSSPIGPVLSTLLVGIGGLIGGQLSARTQKL